MNLKKILFSFALIISIMPTIQASMADAIGNNDIKTIERLFKQDPYSLFDPIIDPITSEIMAPIHKAAMAAQDTRILELLLQNGALINALSKNGKTPLFYALNYNSNPNIATFLINQGAILPVTSDTEKMNLGEIYEELLKAKEARLFKKQEIEAFIDLKTKNSIFFKAITSPEGARFLLQLGLNLSNIYSTDRSHVNSFPRDINFNPPLFNQNPTIDVMAEIQRAYREKALKLHPDKNPSLGQLSFKIFQDTYDKFIEFLEAKYDEYINSLK